MPKRRPPDWPSYTDRLADACGVQTVTFHRPVPANAACHYCGGVSDSRDHIVPDSVGGSRHWWNLVPSCSPCNLAKDDRQSCSCMFCLRAMALWSLGFRREGKSWREKKRPAVTETTLTPEKLAALAELFPATNR